ELGRMSELFGRLDRWAKQTKIEPPEPGVTLGMGVQIQDLYDKLTTPKKAKVKLPEKTPAPDLKIVGLTVASLAISPVLTIESVQGIGLKKTVEGAYEKAKRLALEQHAIEIERAFLYGIHPSEGKMKGMIGVIRRFKN
ncbi:unnamed protein product, partial [marine sediment metagenome]